MRIFKAGESYIFLWFIWAPLFMLAALDGHVTLAFTSMPVLAGGILISELQSDIALDSWWTAKYEKGTWQYTAMVIWHACGTILFSILAWLVYSNF